MCKTSVSCWPIESLGKTEKKIEKTVHHFNTLLWLPFVHFNYSLDLCATKCTNELMFLTCDVNNK